MVEGLVYHRVNKAIEYIDNFIRYSCENKTSTHLKYLGYRQLTPKEEYKFIFNKASKVTYDIAKNDIYLVEFNFQYAEEPEIRKYYFYIPFMDKGNIIHLSGNNFLVMPVFADKVVSIGDKIIFINILTAKYSFDRIYYTISVNGVLNRVSVIVTELYKNQIKKLEDTTKAKTIVMHYLLANYGYKRTMELLLGFAPIPVYDVSEINKEKYVVLETVGNPPPGYIKNKKIYEQTRIKFLVEKNKYNEDVLYSIGNMFYVIDHFPDIITIDSFEDVFMWKRLLAEIILSGNHGLAYLSEKINAHFTDLNSSFDIITLRKLKDIGVESNSLIELLSVIFKNFNKWILNAELRSLYHNKTFEVESFVLSHITSKITRTVLDINKEELRVNGLPLESKQVDKIFKNYFVTRAIYALKKERQFVTSIEYSGDLLYPKNTAMVAIQESDFININKKNVSNAEKKKIVASMATIGSILGLSKKNPIPIVRLNPYVNVDYVTGTVLPHPDYDHIVEQTDKLLANMIISDTIEDTEVDSESITEEAILDDTDTFDDYDVVEDMDFD